MNRKKIIIILSVAAILIATGIFYLLKIGIVSININNTKFKDPVSGKTITREEFKNKSAADLYKDAIEFNKKGNYEDASDFLNGAIQKDDNSTNINVMRELAVAYYNMKKYDEAVSVYNKIIEINPEQASAYNELGNVYRDMGDNAMAEDSYRKAVAIDANYILAYNNLAMLFVRDNNFEEARKAIQEGLEKNQDSLELQMILKSLENN